MLNERQSRQGRMAHLFADGLLMLTVAAGTALAQGLTPMSKQGFEPTAQNPADYTPEEKQAVAVVLKWIETTDAHDTLAHMALISDNAAYRGDPPEPLKRGAQDYCMNFFLLGNPRGSLAINKLFVVGGPRDAVLLLSRTDINGPYNGSAVGGGLGGYPVPVSVMVRVRNGKVVEWYDMPVNKVSIGAQKNPPTLGVVLPVSERCKPYAVGGNDPAARAVVPNVTLATPKTYGTNEPQFWMSPYETRALEAVRGFFAAREAGSPLSFCMAACPLGVLAETHVVQSFSCIWSCRIRPCRLWTALLSGEAPQKPCPLTALTITNAPIALP
jgi:hypothetical protein